MWMAMILAASLTAYAGSAAGRAPALAPDRAAQWLALLGVGTSGEGRERLIVVDRAGRISMTRDGEASHVVLGPDLDARLLTPGAGLTLVHNHPQDHGLSPNDLAQLDKPGVDAVAAVGHDGSLYVARRGPRYPTASLVGLEDGLYARARDAMSRVLTTERDPAARKAFDAHRHHVLTMALAANGTLEYEATLSADRLASFVAARMFLARVRDAATRAVRE